LAQILGNHICSNCVKICRVFSTIMSKNVPDLPTSLSMPPASLRTGAAGYAAGDAGVMFFLLRMAFWLGVVLILLPSSFTQRGPSTNDVGTGDAISAASATVEDLRGFCTRQPDACTVGSHLATAIGYKAQAGAKMLYDVLSEALARRHRLAHARRWQRRRCKSAAQTKSLQRASQNAHSRRPRPCLARTAAAEGRQARGIARSSSARGRAKR
jgi:hypothetical protein